MVDATSKRILVVDDAALIRLYFRDALERAGFTVSDALNGLEALEKLGDAAFDLLIVDVNMPRMDGMTFLKVLRRQPVAVACIPALVISSEAGPQDMEAARLAGANHYLVKSVAQDVLVAHALLLTGSSPTGVR